MLNFDIKRKINTLRDILVGKVPDPKAQVEQITIALIYKFMDDMDLEGMEFGARREFFKEDYEKYAWSNIMQPENSGQQRSNLYAEGIDKMSTNPHLPQLFRDIFRGAYVPYRDPETLNMFLKEINDFTYDHSEELGNAFEYLLSIMGSQGDAGQFRTPRHIIDMIVEIVDPQKTDSVLDPACGTAGFLISSYKHILEKNRDADGNSTLSADDRKRMTENFAGYDISPDMVRLSRVNMYLHKFAKPRIYEYDALTSLDRWDETYDVILANPPFMTPKGGIIPHNRYRVPAKRSEVLFVDYIAEHLNPTGKAGIIVPEGIVFQSANAYKSLRKYLIDDGLLYAVISLPAGVFNPYSGVKTSILLFDKTIARQKDEVLFVKVNNDGYDLGAQRREIKSSDIPEVIKIIKDYKEGKDVSGNKLVTIAKKRDIAEQDYILVGERYKESIVITSDYPLVEIGDICEVMNGFAFESKKYTDNGIRIIRITNVQKGLIQDNDPKFYPFDSKDDVQKYLLEPGDILVSLTGNVGRAGMIPEYLLPAALNQRVCCLRPKNTEINRYYLFSILNTDMFENSCISSASGIAQKNLSTEWLKKFRIPLPPLHVQEKIVKEIEGYQKIIDGARQVVENYKPTITLDPNWEIVKLGEICEINAETLLPENIFFDREFIYLDISSVENGTGKINYDNLIAGKEAPSRARRKVKNGSILLSTVRPNLKAFGFIEFEKPELCVASTGFAVIDVKKADNKFVYYSIFQDYLLNQMINSMGKGAYPSINQSDVNNLSLALPSQEVQQKIVALIDEEVKIVLQNKRLIEIFEQRIMNLISGVWGE